jgi:mevalonate kinase
VLPVAVSTPGKLILMGEHAAVYGRPALVAAIDRRLTARFSAASHGIHLELPGLQHVEETSWPAVLEYARDARRRWDDYAREPGPEAFGRVRGEDPAHGVKVALGEVAGSLGLEDGPPLTLRIESELPVGSGFGSSAALAVAVIAGSRLALGAAAETAEAERVERLALEVERRQHGQPSGVDGATVVHGGVIWARRRGPSELEREPVTVRSPLLSRLHVFDTGMPPETTGAVVAAVRGRRDRDPARHERLLDRMEAATRAFRAELARELEESDEVVRLLQEQEACLEELGVVPAPIRDIVRRVELEGGAAKISGAGSLAGPGAGSLLVYHSDRERVAGWQFLRSFRFHSVQLGAPGFRREG